KTAARERPAQQGQLVVHGSVPLLRGPGPGYRPHLTTPATILRSRRPETERETSEGAGLGGPLLRAAVRWSARALRNLDRPPDSFGRRRHLEVLDAEIG